MAERSGRAAIERVPVPKASDVLADQLRSRILDGVLEAGSTLPNERALATQSGLSRTVVREALRILEIEGLVTTRPGRNGGTFVRVPDAQMVARFLDMFIRGRRVRFEDILEVREQVEPICAQLAAGRRTEQDLDNLERVTERCRAAAGDVPAFLQENVAWHLAVAEASHNELFAAFMIAISEAILAATDIEDFNSPDVRGHALAAHDAVLGAIRGGDRERAERAMRRHVHAYREEAASAGPHQRVPLLRPGGE